MNAFHLHINFLKAIGLIVFLSCLGFVWPLFYAVAQIGFIVLVLLILIDVWTLFNGKVNLQAKRVIASKISNGDQNPVKIIYKGEFTLKPTFELIDEYPIQLQIRNDKFVEKPNELSFNKELEYHITPTTRGEYQFGKLHILASTPIQLVKRKFTFNTETTVKVYPSFIQYKRYAFLAMSNRLEEAGVKKIRQLGGLTEFEQIKEYVRGDDYRRINWKATARRQSLQVNHFVEEKAQNIYLIIDKGRHMHMPFKGLALFDYAINSALVMAGVAVGKGDKAGLITFSDLIGSFITANSNSKHISAITEALYAQETRNKESDFLRLYKNIRARIKRRSLFILFTNFESYSTMKKQLPYLQAIAKQHLLLVVIFENTTITELATSKVNNTEQFYQQTIAEQLSLEKEIICKELQQHGIQTLLTPPENLSINTINTYIQLKSRGAI